jgi:predicted RNA-binding Zn ribbon-like protein
MPESHKTQEDWRGDHLFVGNRLALDFLNTELASNGEALELLPDATAVARWMVHADLLTETAAKRLEQAWVRNPRIGKTVVELRRFRDRLRAAVFALEAGSPVAAEFLDYLNSLLQTHPMYPCVRRDGDGGYSQTFSFEPRLPDDLLGPLAQETMILLTGIAADRVRKCEGCPVHFLDVSKKAARRWCSMKLCGNKVKVAAYQQRQRQG